MNLYKCVFCVVFLFLVQCVVAQTLKYSLPFEENENRIFLDGKINNKKCVFLFDTGQGQFSIEENFFSNLNIKRRMQITVELEDDYEQKLTKYDTQNIKEYIPNAIYSAVINLEFFNDYIVEIDYENKKLNLYERKDNSPLNSSVITTLSINKDNLFLYGFFYARTKIKVGGTIVEGGFLIDTGSGRYVTLLNYENKLDSLKNSLTEKGKILNIKMNKSHFTGLHESLFTKNTKLYLGKNTYDNVIADISDVNIKYYPKNYFVGIIGGGFLKNFKLRFSYVDNKMQLLEEQTFQNKEKLITDGFRLTRKGKKCFVSSIISAETASKVHIGDEIIAVDGVPMRKVEWERLLQKKSTKGVVIHYKIKRGRKEFLYDAVVQDFFRFL